MDIYGGYEWSEEMLIAVEVIWNISVDVWMPVKITHCDCHDFKPTLVLVQVQNFSEPPFCESLSTNLSGTKKKYYQIKNTKGSNVPMLQKHLLPLSILAPVNHRHESAIWYEILCLPLKLSMWCLTCQQFSQGDKHIVNSKITFRKQHLDSCCDGEKK